MNAIQCLRRGFVSSTSRKPDAIVAMPAKRLYFFNLRLSLSFIIISLMLTTPAKRLHFFDSPEARTQKHDAVIATPAKRLCFFDSEIISRKGDYNAYEEASFL
jgi:hypothetical protein